MSSPPCVTSPRPSISTGAISSDLIASGGGNLNGLKRSTKQQGPNLPVFLWKEELDRVMTHAIAK